MKKNKPLSVEGFKSKLTQFDVDVDEISIIVLLLKFHFKFADG